MKKYEIENIHNYPDNGKHLEVYFEDINYPFEIRKGEDSYIYYIANEEIDYNRGKTTDQRWIAHLTSKANSSLKLLFQVYVNKDLTKVLEYCYNTYIESLKLEITRLTDELEKILMED